MARIRITDDFAWAGLCRDCQNSVLIEDEAGKRLGHCTATWEAPLKLVSPIKKCNSYRSKHDVSLSEMREIAWTLQTDAGRLVGFKPPEPKKKED